MAFVSEKPLPESVANKTAAANVGPGQYDVDSVAHKQLMAAIYPKRAAPFNSTDKREKERKQSSSSPGPGAYNIEKIASPKGLAAKDSYIVNDNGHLTQRTQPYSLSKKLMSVAALKEPEPIGPGPGSYNPHRSTFETPQRKASPRGAVINPVTVVSPIAPGRAAAAVSNPALQKMSVPSIPSRFLTPIIDGTQDESGEAAGDICKMSRLVEDPSKVGPGTYQIMEDQIQKSPRGAINWQHSQSQRSGIKPSARTQETVGPGSYNGDVKFYKPSQPFIPRSGLVSVRNRPRNQGSTSIRGNYEGEPESDDEDLLLSKKKNPGPGHYLTQDSSFKSRARPTSLQLFGSGVKRFTETHNDSGLGPGQYRARNTTGVKYNSVLRAAGSAAFKSPKRTEQISVTNFDMPGPGDYMGEQIRQTVAKRIKDKQINKDRAMQFAVKAKRFEKDDTISPGPAAYKLPDACQVRNPKAKMASYASTTERELKHFIGKENPGVGQYETGENTSMTGNLGKGGGAPSNFTIGYPHLNPTIRRVETVVPPRLPDPDKRTPLDVGPGSYLLDKAELKGLERFKPQKYAQKETIWESSARFTELQKQTSEQLGPGAYREINKWNKRTYNLKFLNNQTQVSSTPAPMLKNGSFSPSLMDTGAPSSKQIQLNH